MTKHCNPQEVSTSVLAALLTEHPEITGMTWSVDPSGVVHGSNASDDGRTVTALARILGGTPLRRTTSNPIGDRLTLTELVTVWRGVHFDVWTTHETPAEIEDARPLGCLLPARTGGAR